MKFHLSLLMTIVLASAYSQAQNPTEEKSWKHESEVAVVTTQGNTDTESYAAKQKTGYNFDLNVLTLAGSFLQTKTSNVETARNWDASLRYERNLSMIPWSLFAQVGAEANPYAGFTQRDNADLGIKRYFIKEDKRQFFVEVGPRASRTQLTTGTISSETLGRAYLEYTQPITETVDGKFWVEYLANFTTQGGDRVSAEPSLYVAMNNIFSLKLAYLTKIDNARVAPASKYDNQTTVSLVGKF